jgi:hypothetical protein
MMNFSSTNMTVKMAEFPYEKLGTTRALGSSTSDFGKR